MNKSNNKDGRWAVITLGVIIALLILSYLFYGIHLSIKTRRICEKECNAYGGLHHQRIPNGKMDTNDLCICYFEDSIKSWRLGQR